MVKVETYPLASFLLLLAFSDKWDLPVLGISTTSLSSPSDVEETGSNFPEVDVI